MKKLWLSPYLKSHSPHVANGDKVGQRWSKFMIPLVKQSLLEVHATASKHDDAQMTDFLEGNFLKEQVEAIKHLGDLITKMKRAGDGLGVHIIDKELSS